MFKEKEARNIEAKTHEMTTSAGKVLVEEYANEATANLIPIVFIPGWGEGIATFEKSLKETALRGNRVLGIELVREPHQPAETVGHPNEQSRKAAALIESMTQLGITSLCAVAHSEGAVNTTRAALLNPGMFKKLVLVNPSGIGDDNFAHLATRFAKDVASRIGKANSPDPQEAEVNKKSLAQTKRYIATDMVRATREGGEIALSDIRDDLKHLLQLGIKVYVIGHTEDPVYPSAILKEKLANLPLTGYYEFPGDHNTVYTDPGEFIDLVDRISKEE